MIPGMRKLLVLAFLAGCRAPAPEGPPAAGASPVGPSSSFSCFTMTSGQSRGSFCYADAVRCESERVAAQRDGGVTNPCYRQSPVSCFQLRNDARPEMEMCAVSVADCDFLRRIDEGKNGTTAPSCEWRHGQ